MKMWLSCVVWVVLAAPLSAETIDRIVATVNGRPVMESELAEQLRFEQSRQRETPYTRVQHANRRPAQSKCRHSNADKPYAESGHERWYP